MTNVVADASALIRRAVPRRGSAGVARALDRAPRVTAPDWALVECANALWRHVRANELSEAEALRLLDTIANAEIDFQDSKPLLPRALELATLIGHPVYDCLYLTLAIVEQAPVVTTDRRLARTAADAGLGDLVTLIEGD